LFINYPNLNKLLKLRFVLFSITILFFSCNPTKHLKPDEIFLQSTVIKKDNRKIDADGLKSIIKQEPNKKILSIFRYHLGIYNIRNKKGTKQFKDVGEPPVVYDQMLTEKSVHQMHLYLNNKGYYDNIVTYTEFFNNNKVAVQYKIETGQPYLMNKIRYHINDKNVQTFVLLNHTRTLLRAGNNFDIDLLDKERTRIKNLLKNEGYFYFEKSYIKFKVDSTIGNHQINIDVHISKDFKNDSAIVKDEFQTYDINNINVYIAKSFRDSIPEDITIYDSISIRYNNELQFNPKLIKHALGLKRNELYKLENHQNTYKHFSGLHLFKSVNVNFEDVGKNELNANVYLATAPIKSFSAEVTGTNTGGYLGLGGSLLYQNRNIFKGGEKLSLKLAGGVEAQQLINDESATASDNLGGTPFNTIEFGPEITLEFPRLLLPFFKLEDFSTRLAPKTSTSVLLNFQTRPEYTRTLLQLNFGYFWKAGKYKKHFVYPVNNSLIKLNSTPEFQKTIDEEDNPFLKNSYTDHFINSSSYTFIYNNQRLNYRRNFIYFKFNTEFAGNMLTAFNNITNKPYDNPDTKSWNTFGIRYAQFVKTDFDIRHYQQKKITTFVKRLYIGIGKPYGNLDVLPFEKSYYGGGANGIRAWEARSLGPGSLSDTLSQGSINQIGDLKIETNLEYRFKMTKIFEGAAFIDAGNIWIIKEDEKRPNAEFKLDKLWNDLAIGVGVGLRLDFNFFLIRFDLAAKLKDPSKPDPTKFDLKWRHPTLNLGIGYPF